MSAQTSAAAGARSAVGTSEFEIAVRSIAFNVLFYALMIVTLIVTAPWALIISRDHLMSFVRAWSRDSSSLLKGVCKLDYEIRGAQNLPKGGFIFAGKHQSFWETVAFISYLHDPCYVIKRELSYLPIWGWYAIKARMVFVSRGRGQAALREITEGGAREAAAGRPIMFFPEGTRRPPGAAPAYKFGVTHLYRTINVPAMPVALNSGLYWPRRKFLRYPGKIIAEFLPPILPGLSAEDFPQQLIGAIEECCDRLLLEADAAAPRPPFGPEAEERLRVLRSGR